MKDPRQHMLDGLAADMQRERAASQCTLGKLIDAVAALHPDEEIDGIEYPHSYRGYYCDLAFNRSESGRRSAANTLAMLRECMGKVFTGYKGGEYMMGEATPVWIAEYGCCGDKIVGLSDGRLLTESDD